MKSVPAPKPITRWRPASADGFLLPLLAGGPIANTSGEGACGVGVGRRGTAEPHGPPPPRPSLTKGGGRRGAVPYAIICRLWGWAGAIDLTTNMREATWADGELGAWLA